MKAPDALKMIVKESDISAIEISSRIGRKSNYVSSLLSRGSTPTAETLATIAGACGYRLCLVRGNEAIDLDGWSE